MDISVRSVTKRYGSVTALDDVSLEVPSGSLTALLGPSGDGKSTLLRVIAGLDMPDEGAIAIGGSDVTRVPARRRGIGFCFQSYAPFRHLTVAENVAFGLRVRRRSRAEIRTKVAEMLDLVRLTDQAERYPAQLSGGQVQRMALARALAIEPAVLLLDEPFGALDAQVRKDLRVWLRGLHDQLHITTLLVTHDREEAMEVADQVAVIHGGRIEQVGSPLEVYDQPVNDFVLTFLGPATRLDGQWIRPHDLVLDQHPRPGARQATVERVVAIGFEVRVHLLLGDGDRIWAQLPRAEAAELELGPGGRAWVRMRDVGAELAASGEAAGL